MYTPCYFWIQNFRLTKRHIITANLYLQNTVIVGSCLHIPFYTLRLRSIDARISLFSFPGSLILGGFYARLLEKKKQYIKQFQRRQVVVKPNVYTEIKC